MRVVEGTATIDDVDAFLDELDAVAAATDCAVQAFDARYVVGRRHLERAVELADRAIERGENVARERAVEVLLYAAGRRQIDRALAMGVGEGTVPVAAVVVGEDGDEAAAAERVRSLLDPGETVGADRFDPERVRAFFDVTEREVVAADGDLAGVVLERVALLDVEK